MVIPGSNVDFAQHSTQFRIACRLAKVEPTRRQASKYRAGRGRAYEVVRRLYVQYKGRIPWHVLDKEESQ